MAVFFRNKWQLSTGMGGSFRRNQWQVWAGLRTFQGSSVEEIENAFKDSIDDYLEFCRERKEKPDKPFSGKFVLRISSELHHKLYLNANKSGKSINKWVVELLEETVN